MLLGIAVFYFVAYGAAIRFGIIKDNYYLDGQED